MTQSGPSVAAPWRWLTSGVGYHLDNVGSWLLQHVPRLGRMYAAAIMPQPPQADVRPGWRFAEEYYDQRRWAACRRGALWETARAKKLSVPVSVPWLAGTSVEVTLGNDNSLCLYVCGSFEPNEFAFLDRLLKPGMVFVDVGANEGYYSLFASRRVTATGRVVAVEPSARERARLERNLARNAVANAVVVPVALGAAPGTATLKLAQGQHSGHNTLGDFAHDDVRTASSEVVSVETLDSLSESLALTRVDVVKIDVEGGEPSVVFGAETMLARHRPVILIEANEPDLGAAGSDFRRMVEILTDRHDYRLLNYSAVTGLLEPWAREATLSANIVASPRERVTELLRDGRRND